MRMVVMLMIQAMLSACMTSSASQSEPSAWIPLMTQSFEVSLPGMPRTREYLGFEKASHEPIVTRTFTLEQGPAAYMIGEVDLPERLAANITNLDILQKSALFEERLQQSAMAVKGRIAQTKLINFRGFEAQLALIEVRGYRFENVLFIANGRQYQLQFLASLDDWDRNEVSQARREFFESFQVLKRKEPESSH